MGRIRAGVISILLLAVLTGAAWSLLAQQDPHVSTLRSAFLKRLGAARPTEGRLYGFFYAEYPTQAERRSARLLSAIRPIEAQVARVPNSKGAIADLAVTRLSLGRVNEAVLLFERVSPTRDREEAWIWSDLAAAYMERAAALNNPADLLWALEAAYSAVELDGALEPARFNLALALERNLLLEEALEAWSEVIHQDFGSHWGREARSHHKKLSALSAAPWERHSSTLEDAAFVDQTALEEVVSEFPGWARKHGEEILARRWAEAVIERRTVQESSYLMAMERLGKVLADRGEPMLLDFVTILQRHSRGSILQQTAEAQLALSRGRLLCRDGQGARGGFMVQRALDLFKVSESPMWLWASVSLATCLYTQSEYDLALERLDGIPQARLGRYPSIVAKMHWIRGMCLLATARPSEALAAYQVARQIYQSNGAREDLGAVEYLISEALRYLGEEREAWRTLFGGLNLAVREGDLWRQYAAFDEVGDAAAKANLPRASLAFRERVVAIARATPDPPSLAHSLMRRAEALLALERENEAEASLYEALRASEKITDSAARSRRQADVLLALGKLHSRDRPRESLQLIDQAQLLYKTHNELPLVDTFTVRAAVLLRLGNRNAALQDLEAGTRELEVRRQNIQDEESRVLFFEQSRRLFEARIVLELSQPEVAFATVERFRARSLLDRLTPGSGTGRSPGAAKPFSSAAIQAALPPKVVLVEFVVLPDEVLIWIISRNNFGFRRMRDASVGLAGTVRQFRRSLQSGQVSSSEAEVLYQLLVKPMQADLHLASTLVIVPDGILHQLPFAALRNPSTGRFLVETFEMSIAPSGSTLALMLDQSRRLGREAFGRVLVVGNPEFDRTEFPKLGSLQGGEWEAQKVAGLYGSNADLLTGKLATANAVLSRMSRATVLHIAAHSIPNERQAALSRLILAPLGESDTGTLFAREFEEYGLPRTRLAVIASCRSSRGVSLGAEGSQAFSRSLLAAGVPSVLGSMWDMPDTEVAGMFVSFHQAILAGESPARALRMIQLEMIRKTNRQSISWASLQVAGGLLPITTRQKRRDNGF